MNMQANNPTPTRDGPTTHPETQSTPTAGGPVPLAILTLIVTAFAIFTAFLGSGAIGGTPHTAKRSHIRDLKDNINQKWRNSPS